MTSSGRPRQPQVDGTTQVKLPHEYGVCDLSSSRESHGSAVCLSGPFDSRVALSLVSWKESLKLEMSVLTYKCLCGFGVLTPQTFQSRLSTGLAFLEWM